MNLHEFYIGKAFDAYEYFGAHITKDGVLFRVYAPCAEKIELIGEFNDWDGSEDEMIQDAQSGVFECVQEDAEPGMMYKYRIYQKDGIVLDRFDPYSFGSQVRPDTASIIVDLDQYHFSDSAWIKKRCKNYDLPVNIYEVHAGSWRKNEADEENGWYHYNELARQLIPYIKEMGYTHVEFLPLTEHPADCSWGYQASGYFCPTSRYGTAGELMEMVDLFHKEGIGVIMDFVPVHFIADTYALNKFDGTALYEYADDDKGYSEWGTCNFNYYRGEVRSFLQSSANFWMEKFHFDGIRMDAISNAIYWQGDSSKGINEGALDFIKCMNSGLQKLHPSVMLIAEDSTNFPKVTAPVEYDGLGFDYKWDMGWMNDTLDYFRIHPYDRKFHYHKLSFSMMYFYNEHYLLPFSHDEVVHGIPSKKRVLKEGDIVSLDAGVIHKGYHSDAARTYGIGKISDEAAKLIEVTRQSFFEGIKYAKEGCHLYEISNAIAQYNESFGYGVIRDLVGHGIGTELHEEPEIPNFRQDRRGIRLYEGMTLAIEPMVSAGDYKVRWLDDNWTASTFDHSLSAHYENTVLVTKAGPEILSLVE